VNYVALLVLSGMCLFVLWLIFTPFAVGYDYFESFYRVSGWYEQPLICIINPQPEWKYYAIHAVDIWERQLHEMAIYEYDYRITVYDKVKERCTATISFGSPNEVWSKFKSEVGGTQCFESMVIHDKKHNVIRNGTRTCIAVINPDWQQGRALYSTIVHETGHILGIGHRQALEIQYSPYVFNTKDIMNVFLQSTSVVTPQSIEALQHFTDYNGWNGGKYVNYTIPHD